MHRPSIAIVSGTFLILLISCSSAKNLVGTYHSNFAVHGFFGTTIVLNQDSTLVYSFTGDLISEGAKGRYQVYDDKVFIMFDKDSQYTTQSHSRFDKPIKNAIFQTDTISYQLLCYIGHNKLFQSNIETGKKVTKARGYWKRKQYLLFGSNWYERRYYLMRAL